jgi:hypothetical protein
MAYQGESGLIAFSTSILLIAVIALVYHRLPGGVAAANNNNELGRQQQRRRPVQLFYHLLLLGLALVVILLVPTSVAKYVFTDLAVTAVGTVFPIYESIRAVCTPEEDDDQVWLQYWLVGGILFMLTGWVDNVLMSNDGSDDGLTATIVWYEAACFFFLWLYLPQTNGVTFVYDHFTYPILTPLAKPLATKLSDWIVYAYQTLINGVHLWLLWIIFAFMPFSGLKRIIAIAIGTVYPWLASTAAAATATDEIDDTTTWLTYWSCYGLLFLIMDVVEAWLYWVPGFYSLVIFATVYLMLPMFRGAEKVFRHVLVPLAGLQELLLLRDAIQVKKSMLKTLPPERAAIVRKAIAKFFDDNGNNDANGGPNNFRAELDSGWRKISLRNLVTYNVGADDGGNKRQNWEPMV